MPDLFCPNGEHFWDDAQHCENMEYCDDAFCAVYCKNCPEAEIWCEQNE